MRLIIFSCRIPEANLLELPVQESFSSYECVGRVLWSRFIIAT